MTVSDKLKVSLTLTEDAHKHWRNTIPATYKGSERPSSRELEVFRAMSQLRKAREFPGAMSQLARLRLQNTEIVDAVAPWVADLALNDFSQIVFEQIGMVVRITLHETEVVVEVSSTLRPRLDLTSLAKEKDTQCQKLSQGFKAKIEALLDQGKDTLLSTVLTFFAQEAPSALVNATEQFQKKALAHLNTTRAQILKAGLTAEQINDFARFGSYLQALKP